MRPGLLVRLSPRRSARLPLDRWIVGWLEVDTLCPCGPHHGPQDPPVGAAPAQVSRQGLFDVIRGRMWCLHEQGARAHDHAARAVAALRGLLGDEGRLQRIRFVRAAEAFYRRHPPARDSADRDHAGARRPIVDEDRAAAALPEPASQLRAGEPERTAKRVEQWLAGVPGGQRSWASVDAKRVGGHFTGILPGRDPGLTGRTQESWVFRRIAPWSLRLWLHCQSLPQGVR